MEKIYVLTYLLLLGMQTKAQFVAASQTDLAATVTVTPSNTGNDIYNDGTNTYRVHVCSDNNYSSPSLFWDVDYGSSTHDTASIVLAATNDIYHADVSITFDGLNIYAEVAWYVGGTAQAVYLQEYIWNTSPAGFTLNKTLFWNETGVNTINIDADNKGNFVVVYDNYANHIYAIAGTCNGLNIGTNNPLRLPNNGIYPDVSLYNDGTNPIDAHLVYLATTATTLEVENASFTNWLGGTNTVGSLLTATSFSGYYYFAPRIATPNSSGANGDFTVVVQETNHSNKEFIVGYNSATGTTPIVYNNSTYSPYFDISNGLNNLPCVAYDDQNNTWIGWTFDDNGSGIFYANTRTPFVIKCNTRAVPNSNSNYWVVPVGVGTGAMVDYLSLAGRYGNDQLFLTYYNVGNTTVIYYKDIQPSTATSCRIAQNSQVQNNAVDLEGIYSVKIYSMSGQLVYSNFSNVTNLNLTLQTFNTKPGMYLYKMIDSKGAVVLTKKYTKIY